MLRLSLLRGAARQLHFQQLRLASTAASTQLGRPDPSERASNAAAGPADQGGFWGTRFATFGALAAGAAALTSTVQVSLSVPCVGKPLHDPWTMMKFVKEPRKGGQVRRRSTLPDCI